VIKIAGKARPFKAGLNRHPRLASSVRDDRYFLSFLTELGILEIISLNDKPGSDTA
jgi:hypothetical protein